MKCKLFVCSFVGNCLLEKEDCKNDCPIIKAYSLCNVCMDKKKCKKGKEK